MNNLLKLIAPRGIMFTSWYHSDNQIQINCKSAYSTSKCPSCGKRSKHIHSYYKRKVRDLAISGSSVILNLRARKLYCRNKGCGQRIFSERIDEISYYSRYTKRSIELLGKMVIETSANKTSYLSSVIQLPVSSSTALRIAHSKTIDDSHPINTLGIDDWAIRKGVNYGTILINIETNRVINLLPGRDGKELKPFLARHPEIKRVCRDRSSSYSAAVTDTLPNAIQIADRFHLVKNLSDAIYDVIKVNYHSIKKIFSEQKTEARASENVGRIEDRIAKNRPREEHYTALYYQVKEFRKKGIGLKTISREFKISRNTVRKYDMLDKPVNKMVSHRNNYQLFVDRIQHMIKNQHSKHAVYQAIKKLGFDGSYTCLCTYIQNNLMDVVKVNQDKAIPYLSARKMSIFLGMKRFNRINSEIERNLFRKILKKSSLLRKLRRIYLDFKALLTSRDSIKLDIWI